MSPLGWAHLDDVEGYQYARISADFIARRRVRTPKQARDLANSVDFVQG